ncbi:MAG TPA: ComEC/Rec2 family competence protein [Flavobacteriales bacterium]
MVGILLQIHVGIDWRYALMGTILFISLWYYYGFVVKIKFNNRWIHGVLINGTLVGLGVLLTISKNPLLHERHINNIPQDTYDLIEVRIAEAPILKSKSYKSVTEILATWKGNERQKATGELLLYIENDSLAQILSVDDTLLLATKISELHEVQNPFEFNYRQYLNNHFIYAQAYVSTENWALKSKAHRHSFTGFFITIREKMLAQLRAYGVEGQEYAVLSALVLGKTSEIDYHLMLSYASAGAIHILAVSGLHVGLIYMLLSPLLKRLPKTKRWWWIKIIVPCVLLWMYAGITGFSPSVLRAACMFSIFILSESLAKKNNIYNSMSASALVLLWWNPYMIMEVGFQLSYLAVLGIVVLQDPIYKLIYTTNFILRWMWSLTAVSISAQISTFSLGLLYFHQFPNLFLISNLFVIPLSTLILYVSLAFYPALLFPPLAKILIWISTNFTWLMNQSMLFVDSLPYSITQNISISILESYLIAGISIFGCYWLLWRKPNAIAPMLACTCVLCVTQVSEKVQILRNNEICIHAIPKHQCITYSEGETGTIFYTNNLVDKESAKRFHLKNYWDHLGIKEFHFVNMDSLLQYDGKNISYRYPYLEINGLRFCWLDSLSIRTMHDIHADIFILDEPARSIYLQNDDIELLKNKVVILGEGIGQKKATFISEQFPEKSCYRLSSGALIIRDKTVFHFSEFY